MSVPRVAIVGRPNVGKSSLFNWLSGRLISVVDPTAGVTRDRVTFVCEEGGRFFELVDTGGIGIIDSDALEDDVEAQIRVGIETADAILFVVDARAGVVPLDEEVAAILRKRDVPKLLVVNKCDAPKYEQEVGGFLGLTEAPHVAVSVKGSRNRAGLVDALLEILPPPYPDEAEKGRALRDEPELKLALVGRRNVGKSTFLNALAEQERVIVSEVAGTTRDSIDIRFEGDGRTFVAIDTPGVRRKKSLDGDVEFYGLVRAQKSIRRADVVLMMFDSQKTISKVDKQLLEDIAELHKPCIFVVTKWDLGLEAGMTTDRWAEYFERVVPTLGFVPVAFVTAKEGKNVRPIINLAQAVHKQARERVSTGKLNAIVREAIDENAPRVKNNRRPKIYYATQVAAEPPTIVLKCNDPKIFGKDWKRYLLRKLREQTPFEEVPVKMIFRQRDSKEAVEV